jgi:hypothetical protein
MLNGSDELGRHQILTRRVANGIMLSSRRANHCFIIDTVRGLAISAARADDQYCPEFDSTLLPT